MPKENFLYSRPKRLFYLKRRVESDNDLTNAEWGEAENVHEELFFREGDEVTIENIEKREKNCINSQEFLPLLTDWIVELKFLQIAANRTSGLSQEISRILEKIKLIWGAGAPLLSPEDTFNANGLNPENPIVRVADTYNYVWLGASNELAYAIRISGLSKHIIINNIHRIFPINRELKPITLLKQVDDRTEPKFLRFDYNIAVNFIRHQLRKLGEIT